MVTSVPESKWNTAGDSDTLTNDESCRKIFSSDVASTKKLANAIYECVGLSNLLSFYATLRSCVSDLEIQDKLNFRPLSNMNSRYLEMAAGGWTPFDMFDSLARWVHEQDVIANARWNLPINNRETRTRQQRANRCAHAYLRDTQLQYLRHR